jgi:egghead protein (zeste-white 4 protein)
VLKKLLIIEVVTEDANDIKQLEGIVKTDAISVKYYLLPKEYTTDNGTKLKARALQYMVERHRDNPRDAYIVHYDEESVFTPENLARLVRNLLKKPVGISEGSISYPLEWQDAHIICRTMESNRPFGCHECYLVMTHPAPLHLHGSNLVIQERIENEIGWDIGTHEGNALIAEDLVFGLMVFIKYGAKAFGWHGVEMLEQPPFTTKAAFKQRERWIMGALQGVSHVKSLAGYDHLPWIERFKINWVIKFRIVTYAIGFPVSLVSIVTVALTALYVWLLWAITGDIDINLSLLAIPGLVMWLGGTQLGLWQNLRYTGMTRPQKLVEHIKILAMTPFTGIYDTSGPMLALWKWTTGQRKVNWLPTPKLVGQEFGDNVVKDIA